MRMNDLERDYWMGTEVGQLGGLWFQGATFAVDGSCKDGKMGSGCCKFMGEEADKCARVCIRGRHDFDQAGVWGSCVSGYSQQLLAKMSYYCAITQQFCALSKSD